MHTNHEMTRRGGEGGGMRVHLFGNAPEQTVFALQTDVLLQVLVCDCDIGTPRLELLNLKETREIVLLE